MSDLQLEIWNELCKLSGEEVARLFTDWLGDQILDKDFRAYLVNEGYMPEHEEYDDDTTLVLPLDDFDTFCQNFEDCLSCPIMKKYGRKISNVCCADEFEKMKDEEKE